VTRRDSSGGEALVVMETSLKEESLFKNKRRGHGLWVLVYGVVVIGPHNPVTAHSQGP